ncbi:hypothetical protein HHI36_013080 [Cryptolaemus montrouzieri]|uniref:Uncharacterized protein n=1 Tax=Cryptolaemus montrouzieri TaxID=559131 RepID=A0ABD2NGA0_9CUCU
MPAIDDKVKTVVRNDTVPDDSGEDRLLSKYKCEEETLPITMNFILRISCLAFIFTAVRGIPVLTQFNLVQSPSFFAPQPLQAQPTPGILYPDVAQKDLSHPAVSRNALAESQYPPELLNDFYKNPVIAAKLAKESWFTNKEFPVYHREAEKIPRQKIYEIIDRIVNH